MTPIDDPRPFAEVLRDWMTRHDLIYDEAALRTGLARSSLAGALKGVPVRQERALRALMTLVDEARA